MIPHQYIELLKNRKKCSECSIKGLEGTHILPCEHCSNSGFEPLTLIFPEKVLNCKECSGTGVDQELTNLKHGVFKCKKCFDGLIWKEGEEIKLFYEYKGIWVVDDGEKVDLELLWKDKEIDDKDIKNRLLRFKILSLERKRMDELIDNKTYFNELYVMLKNDLFGELKNDEEMVLVTI